MSERRVRPVGRQTYGRAQPLKRPGRQRVKRPHLGLRSSRLLILLVLVAAAGFGLLHLFALTSVTVTSPARGGEIKVEVQKVIDGSWRMGNLLTLNGGNLASKLQQADPSLRSVQVRRQWFHGVAVSVTLKQPSLGWSSGNQAYLLDRDGTAIGAFPAGSALPVVTDGSNLPVQAGQQVTTARFVTFVTGLVPALAADGVNVTGLSIKDTTLDLTVTTKGYYLVFDTSRAVADEMADLKAVQALLTAQKKAPLEYIDLRIAGKAYYK